MMEDSFPMTGGDGPNSYAKNSKLQKTAGERAKPMLVAMILENLEIEQSSKRPFVIADLGCSTGPNTFTAVENIIEAVSQKYKEKGYSTLPEFQVFFNDHVSNDFNFLFANLPSTRKYFAAGAPGSFYGRLFPKASLNYFYSSIALHWLSKVPQDLCNKGRIFYANAPKEVVWAYAAQYRKDMESFLVARAEELVPGGLMTLLLPGRPAGTFPSQYSFGPVFRPFESCLLDMVDEGILSKEKIDSFNIPIYSPSIDELRTLIEENGNFRIAKLECVFPEPKDPIPSAKDCRAVLENLFKQHFESEIVEQLFERYTTKIEGYDGLYIGLNVVLKRNN